MKSNFVALILLNEPTRPDLKAVVKALKLRHPQLSADVPLGDTALQEKGAPKTPLMRVDNELVAVMSIAAPVPDDDALWKRAGFIWPQAAQAVANHQAHLVVAVLGKDKQPLPSARLLTAIVGAVISAVPHCSAVVWDRVGRSAEQWLEFSRRAFLPSPSYPILLWIDMIPARSGRKTVVATVGLLPFANREIELRTGKTDLKAILQTVGVISVYLADHGDVIKHGDTIGGDGNERYRATHTTSKAGVPILLCEGD